MLGIKSDGQPYKVLVVDDSPMIHKIVRKVLEPEGFVICACGNNGQEGVGLYYQHKPDIITMDITMPIMDGLEAAKEIKASNPGVKILMLSAMGDDEIIYQAKQIGINNFARKPFKNEQLIEAISKIIR